MAKKDYSTYKSGPSVAKRPVQNVDQRDKRSYDKATAAKWAARSGSDQKTVNLIGPSLAGVALDAKVNSGVKFTVSVDGPTQPSFTGVAGTLLPNTTGVNVAPDAITNLTAIVQNSTIIFSFDFDTTAPENQYFKQFDFIFTETGTTTPLSWSPNKSQTNTSSSSQTINFAPQDNQSVFGNPPATSFSSIEVATIDTFGNISNYVSLLVIPPYTTDLSVPVISVSPINNGYSVSYTAPTQSDYFEIEISEYDSTASTPPTGAVFTTVYNGKLNPVNVISPDLSRRFVRARFLNSADIYTDYCSPIAVTPNPPGSVNINPPTEITIGATINGTTYSAPYWSNDNVIIPYTLPSSNAGSRFIITLTSPTNQLGYFYVTTDGTSNLNQIATITASNIYGQFGTYFTSFTGLFQSVSASNVNSAGVGITVPTRVNTLSGFNPTAAISNIIDGYTVNFNFGSSGGSSAQVYQFFQDPTSFTSLGDVPDYIDSSWVSGGADTSSTMVVNSLIYENGGFPTPPDPTIYFGYQITGANISPNTYVTHIAATGGNYTLTLSNPLIGQASGNYHLQALVYDGIGPANIFLNYYNTVYFAIAFYDIYGDRSNNSVVYQAKPINPSQSVIQNAVQVGSPNGAIWIGNAGNSSASTGARVVIGDSLDGSYSGIFAYNKDSTSATAPTTSIISNDDGGHSYTFITTDAMIADWSIKTNKIESVITSGITKYTGLSASNTSYSFWAGATSSGNSDSTAPFSVTPLGAVNASNITISGGSLNVGSGNFTVSTTGILHATGAVIDGTITAQGGSFQGNVSISSAGSLYSSASGVPSPTNAGTIFNNNGIFAYTNTSTLNTQMLSAPDADGSTFITSAANIGGWLVNSTRISDKGNSAILSSGDSTYINPTIQLSSGTGAVGMTVGSLSTDTVFWVGNPYATRSTSQVTITSQGILSAKGAILDGSLTVSGTFTAGTVGTSAGNSYITVSNTGTTTLSATTSTNGTYLGSDGQLHSQAVTGKIVLGQNGFHINGISVYGDDGRVSDYNGGVAYVNGAGTTVYGAPFTRSAIYAPISSGNTDSGSGSNINAGDLATGYAIYYGKTSDPIPGAGTGLIGDIYLMV